MEDGEVVFQVVAYLLQRSKEQGAESGEKRFGVWQIPGFVGFPGECDAEELGGMAVEGGGFDIEAEGVACGEGFEEL